MEYDRRHPRKHLRDGWKDETAPIEDLFKRFPLESPSNPPQPERAHLTIVKCIATGFLRGAQVVLCDVTPHDGRVQFRAVAKVYDACWYHFPDSSTYMPYSLEALSCADKEYMWEAAVYQHLSDKGQTGISVPDYFGSWTFSLPLEWRGKIVERNIRLILMEPLDGVCLKDLFIIKNPMADVEYEYDKYTNAFHYQENFRLDVLKEILERNAQLIHAGLRKVGSTTPRNVMLVPRHEFYNTRNTPARLPRVVFIGFTHTIVAQMTKGFRYRSFPQNELPKNPMATFWGGPGSVWFDGWVPPLAEWDLDKHRGWLTQHFGTDDAKSYYMPVDIKELHQGKDNILSDQSTEEKEVSDVDMNDRD